MKQILIIGWCVFIAVGLAVGANLVRADEPTTAPLAVPGIAPTTSPAMDTHTPRGTLKVMARAIAGGDAETIRSCLYAASLVERRMRDAMADFSAGIAKLRAQLEQHFGKAEATRLTGDLRGVLEENTRRIDAATEKSDGENVVVNLVDPNQPAPATVRLKKVGDSWQIVMEDKGQPVEETMMASKADELAARASALTSTADEIEQGKIKSVDEAMTRVQAKMMSLLGKESNHGAPVDSPKK